MTKKQTGNEDYQENIDRKLRLQWNRAFKIFVERVEQLRYSLIEFDVPEVNLGFYGVTRNTNMKIYPTKKCLIGLEDTSIPLIIFLNDFQYCHFERVSFSLKNFDLIFINKSLSIEPLMISSISRYYLDIVKEIINLQNIPFSSTVQNLDWKKMLENIRSDIGFFIENGGWNFLYEEHSQNVEHEVEKYQRFSSIPCYYRTFR